MASANKPGGATDSNDTSPAANSIDPNDPLGYGVYAETLWSRIQHALDRDPHDGELGDDPLVVGLFGEWGVGKSYLLDKIQAHATTRQKDLAARRRLDGGFDLLIPVSFQPWKYEHEEHLHVPILLHVLAALEAGIGESLTFWETAAGKAQKPGDAVIKAMPKAVSLLKKAVFGTAAALDPTTTVAVASTQLLADHAAAAADKRAASKSSPTASTLKYTGDGRYYYEIHKILRSVCRPGKYPDLQGHKLLNDVFRVNFVVFVDDLDRCLPEKAVAVLELIKTIFNVESFAFVLALDDEVIERGIGHRYSDYVLKDKKPQMPITGFEYLEKIVHLPFRIPSMTRDDAVRFLQLKEKEVIGRGGGNQSSDKLWFSPRSVEFVASRSHQLADTKTRGNLEETDRIRDGDTSMFAERLDLHLAHLVLASFDAYVPRKLHRVVELFHQVAAIAAARKRPLAAVLGGDADARIVMALVLLQLFQPELYRCLKRTGTGFDVVRNSFLEQKLSSSLSDQDLLDWVCYGSETREIDEVRGDLTAVMAFLPKLSVDKRHPAQRIRLPIVECLLEHRSVQRHVFDPLKLFAALKASGDVAPFASISINRYYSLLTVDPNERGDEILPVVEVIRAKIETPLSAKSGEYVTTRVGATLTVGRVIPASDVQLVFTTLISAEESEQEQVAVRAGLGEYDQLLEVSAAQIYPLVEKWLNESNNATERIARQRQLLRGLQYFAKHLSDSSAVLFWGLVKNSVSFPAPPNQPLAEPVAAALYADVCALLKQDDRFDPSLHFLLKDRFDGHTAEQEPIPGFVLIPGGPFKMGHQSEERVDGKGNKSNNNPPRVVSIESPFYIARTLTTVDQFAAFLDDEMYVDRVHGGPKSTAMARDRDEARDWRMPEAWGEQRAFGNRPVVRVNWFQARAYARWLDDKLRKQDGSALAKLTGYALRLPNEAQWERAARATGLGAADVHTNRWPYGANERTLKDFANIRESGIGGVSGVGVFPPTAIGLSDIVGNAWQWMDNAYFEIANQQSPAVPLDEERRWARVQMKVSLSLRGGSWIFLPEHARCSFRYWAGAGDWLSGVGFRVVLSVASSSET